MRLFEGSYDEEAPVGKRRYRPGRGPAGMPGFRIRGEDYYFGPGAERVVWRRDLRLW